MRSPRPGYVGIATAWLVLAGLLAAPSGGANGPVGEPQPVHQQCATLLGLGHTCANGELSNRGVVCGAPNPATGNHLCLFTFTWEASGSSALPGGMSVFFVHLDDGHTQSPTCQWITAGGCSLGPVDHAGSETVPCNGGGQARARLEVTVATLAGTAKDTHELVLQLPGC